jgi:hypothetical protein
MTPLKAKDPAGWLLVLLGTALLWVSFPDFWVYLQTGEAFHRYSRLIRFDLYGGDAAAIDGLYVLGGLFLLATGFRKLLFGK